MNDRSRAAWVYTTIAAALLLSACRAERTSPAGETKPAASSAAAPAATPAPKVVEKVPPFVYPAPVKGHFREINTGDFDLVDGVAVPANPATASTVVFAVAKPIASPVLASAPCPMTAARFVTAMRNAGWVEVTYDGGGRSKYFTYGTPFGGSGREQDMGSHPWSIRSRPAEGRAAGSVDYRKNGVFEFDLPRSIPQRPEVSESDRMDGRRADSASPRPDKSAAVAAYEALHKAAFAKDLAGLLAAQGFDAKQAAAIRGLDGIDADFAAFADRFLTHGDGGDASVGPGWASVRAEGVNSKGKKFADYYWFTTCGDKLVLTKISENPQ